MKKIKEGDLLKSLCLRLHIKKSDIKMVVDAFLLEIKEASFRGETIKFWKFGTFSPRVYKKKRVYFLGVSHIIKERIRIIFKAAKSWEREINAR